MKLLWPKETDIELLKCYCRGDQHVKKKMNIRGRKKSNIGLVKNSHCHIELEVTFDEVVIKKKIKNKKSKKT